MALLRRSLVAAALCCCGVLAMAVSPAQAAVTAPNSADRLIMWTGCSALATLTDAELDAWKSRGADGFVCMGKQLWGMGGTQDFTGDPGAALASEKYTLQRSLRDSGIVARAKARDMKMYLGAKLVNYWNTATPLRDWFDDGGWSGTVLPSVARLTAAAKLLGFAGLAFDQELYKQHGGVMTASWNWSYPGNQRSEQAVRSKANQRGRELMTRILGAFPGVEIVAYDVRFPETWGELVQREINGIVGAFSRRLDIDFWNGLSSVEGYGSIRLLDHTFYKTPHLGNWDNALRYHHNRLSSLLSRRLSNWSYASRRLNVSPFSWIGPGPKTSAFDDARPVDYVTRQLEAFRRWGMGGEFADYVAGGLRSFDYTPYASAMSAASTPAVVDSEAPTLTVLGNDGTEGKARLRGTADDNLAVRAVRWETDRGHKGMATLSWKIESGTPRTGYVGKMSWSTQDIPLAAGDNRITVTVEDIKGLTTSTGITVRPPVTAP
jgi:hypothetical protein